jgi:4-amino-4-deoxy-L-arabinose transferase-like glycosyltransferase
MRPNSTRIFVAGLIVALGVGAVLRMLWPVADPPAHAPVGIVWHDEGAWVHNARNRALWNVWRTDEWNPMFISPVFTALEAAAFGLFGVGTWQARTVPMASGLASVLLLGFGLAAAAGRRAAVFGALLLATNYVFVMWNRAALMESTMTAFIVAGWAAYAAAMRKPAFGFLAGASVVLAWFTKAAAAFFVAAITLDAVLTMALASLPALRERLGVPAPDRQWVRAGRWTIAGMAVATGLAAVLFVLPHWSEYWFYNWQMSVTRKPEYTLKALLDRASWLPIVNDFFTRMWLLTVAGTLGVIGAVARWRTVPPPRRLLAAWVLLGLLELIVHDSGNERRYVMFIPALAAFAALVLATDDEPILPRLDELDTATRALLIPLLLAFSYLVIGAIARLFFLYQIGPGVRLSAALAVAAAAVLVWRRHSAAEWLWRQKITPDAATAVVALVAAGDLAQYGQWVRHRTAFNHAASVQLGRVLPPGTLVHGKLANGLSLENQIKPVFVGRGFGNYEDRKVRDDVRYILTYVSPRIGYEGSVILDVLEAYPRRAVVMTFEVAEATTNYDRAALIDKFGDTPAPPIRTGRAHH